jgi:Cyclin, N-terminal domain
MIASKVICDDTYSNKSWSIVGQGMFQLREINQMEREMCQYLDWELNVEPSTLKEFEDMVRKDFAGPGPYPTYVLQTISKLAATSANPFPAIAPNTSTSPIPSFGPRQASPPKSTPPPPSIPTHPAKAYLTPPTTPDTPEPSYSQSTSPASSVSPQTPVSMIDDSVKIVSHDTYPNLSIVEQAALDFAVMKQKMFAFAAPSKW